MESELTAIQNLVNTATSFGVTYGFQMMGAVIILILGSVAARWSSKLALALCERRSIDVTLAKFFANGTRISTMAFVVIIALGKFGITIAPFIAALGAIAFGTSLALQGVLSNYGAGLAIILGRPFVVGNTVTMQGVSGIVEEVNLATTVLGTEDGEQITVPNRQIVGEILTNSYAYRIVESRIGISYVDDPSAALGIIRETVSGIEEVAKDPRPQIGISGFGESSIEIGLRFWMPTGRYHETRYAVNGAVYAAVRSSGITIPYPRREIRMLEVS